MKTSTSWLVGDAEARQRGRGYLGSAGRPRDTLRRAREFAVPDVQPEETMKNAKAIFRDLDSRLRQARWFTDDWNIYNRGEYLQLYKEGWHNDNQGGIHFETYIEAREIRQKAFPICVHAEEDCPHQAQFIRELLAIEGERIRSWKGYKTVGSGYTICQRTLPIKAKNLDQRIFEELSRLRQLESGIEEALRRVHPDHRASWHG